MTFDIGLLELITVCFTLTMVAFFKSKWGYNYGNTKRGQTSQTSRLK